MMNIYEHGSISFDRTVNIHVRYLLTDRNHTPKQISEWLCMALWLTQIIILALLKHPLRMVTRMIGKSGLRDLMVGEDK